MICCVFVCPGNRFWYNQGNIQRVETKMGGNMVKNKFRQICCGFIMDTFESEGEKFMFNPSQLDR